MERRFNPQKEFIIMEYERGLLFKNGRFERLLEPGRYRFWRWEKIEITRVSTRQLSEVLTGQEILSADRINVRVSMIAHYQIADPVLAVGTVESYSERLYQDLQLALREAVTPYTIEQLMDNRSQVGQSVYEQVAPLCVDYGLELLRVGLRDVVLPGTVRDAFLKQIEADQRGKAELIKARHEVAAARARANTARILTENPHIVRMQEIDALISLAGKHGNVVMLPNLADLLTSRVMPATTGNGSNGSNGSASDS